MSWTSRPSIATPTMIKSGSSIIRAHRPSHTSGWSSANRTRIISVIVLLRALQGNTYGNTRSLTWLRLDGNLTAHPGHTFSDPHQAKMIGPCQFAQASGHPKAAAIVAHTQPGCV